jgi:hypothetical protein
MNRPVPHPTTCKRCEATIRFVEVITPRATFPVAVNPVPDRTGNIAARKLGTRYTAGYFLRGGEEPKPGFVVFRKHTEDCPPEAPKHSRSEATPLF